MAAGYTGSIKSGFSGSLTNELTDGGTPTVPIGSTRTTSITAGDAADKADRAVGSTSRSLPVGSETFDLYDLASLDLGAGAGRDPLGEQVTLEEIVAISIHNRSASGYLLVGGEGTAAAWSAPFNGDDDAKLVVLPGGHIQLCAPKSPGYAVTDTTNHLLKVEAVGATQTYDIEFLARD